MILFKSNVVKLTSFSFIVIALVLITLILAESPKVDLKLLPNSSSNLVPKSIKENNSTGGLNLIPTADAQQQPNPNAIQTTPNYPSLIGLLAPTLLPGLNSAEQQLTPYQLRNASPQQLQRLRQLQQMQQQQQQGPGNSPIGQLIGAFLPGGQNLLGGGGANPQNNLNNNQNPGTLARLLGLTPQQQPVNPYLNNNNNNNAALNTLGRQQPSPNANLRNSNNDANNNNSNENSSNDGSSDNADNSENSENNNGEENGDDSNSDSSGDNGNQPQQDPSNDPDLQQFNNLQGNENFPGDLFPKGILSENDLKDIQKSMEEQQKQEAEKQRQQEAEQQGNNENQDGNNGEEDAGNDENADQNSDDQSNGNENSSDDGTSANQTEDPQEDTNDDDSSDKSVSNDGKLNADVNPTSNKNDGVTNLNSINNKLPVNKPTGYSYNNLRPNNFKNVNSNVQYNDDEKTLLNNNRPSTYSNNSPYNNRNPTDELYGIRNRPTLNNRFNDLRNSNRFNNRFNDDLPINNYNRNPYNGNNYGSQVDYSPEYNQDNQYNNNINSDSYNPMNNYRPNQLLTDHLNRQHGDINNFNYRDRLNNGLSDRTRLNRRPNYLNNRQLDRNNLGGLGNERSAVNYDPE